jgi:hypothetical protein
MAKRVEQWEDRPPVHFSASTYKRSGGHPVTPRLPDHARRLKETCLREETKKGKGVQVELTYLQPAGRGERRVASCRDAPKAIAALGEP